MNFDVTLFQFLNGFSGRAASFDVVAVFCAVYLPYLLVLVFLIFVFRSGYPLIRRIELFVAAAISTVVARFVVAELFHLVIHRLRPFVVVSPVHLLTSETGYSFPSGHTIFFFALATVIYLYNRRLGWWFFVLGLIMGVARVVVGVHYPSDILGGMILGVVVGFFGTVLTHRYFIRRIPRSSASGLTANREGGRGNGSFPVEESSE